MVRYGRVQLYVRNLRLFNVRLHLGDVRRGICENSGILAFWGGDLGDADEDA